LPENVSESIEKLAKLTLLYFAFLPLPVVLILLLDMYLGIQYILLTILPSLVVVILWVLFPVIYIQRKISKLSQFGTFSIWKYFSFQEKIGRIFLVIISLIVFFALLFYVSFTVAIISSIAINLIAYWYNKKRIREVLPQKKSDYLETINSLYLTHLKNYKYIALIVVAWIIQLTILFNYNWILLGGNVEGFQYLIPKSWELTNNGAFTLKMVNTLPYAMNITFIDIGQRNGKIPCTNIKIDNQETFFVEELPSYGSSTATGQITNVNLPEGYNSINPVQTIPAGKEFTITATCNMTDATYFSIPAPNYWAQVNIHAYNYDKIWQSKDSTVMFGSIAVMSGSIRSSVKIF
jgi:hypothetical protein